MPWVRIDEHAMEHPKVAGLSAESFRLWVAGLSYCQKYLTDGFISDVALRGLRGFSAKRRDELQAAGLWEPADGGAEVHDYLDWNDSKAHVMNSREQARERLKKHKEKRVANAIENAHPTVTCVVGISREPVEAKTEGGSGETKPDTERVGRFIDRYRDLHERYIGVAYLGNPQKDYWAACELVAAFDDALLEKIAVYGLNDQDAFMTNGTRTLTKLKSRASDYAAALKARKLA